MYYSKQRQAVYDAVMQLYHPTAEQVYSHLKQDGDGVSLATVYRNLRLLAENGAITVVNRESGGDCFDGNPAEHCHLQCVSCGAIFDLPPEDYSTLDQKLQDSMAFTPSRHHFIVYGQCARCAALRPAPSKLG